MLHFGGEEIPPIQVCEVFFFSPLSAFTIRLLLEKHVQRAVLKCIFVIIFGVMCLFLALIPMMELRFLNKGYLTNIM